MFLSLSDIDCGAPPRLPNATLMEDSFSTNYHATVAYRCPLGYGRNGGPSQIVISTCQQGGTWSALDETCQGKQTTANAAVLVTFTSVL